jgi:hypothetical protein
MRKTTNYRKFASGGAVLADTPSSVSVASIDNDIPPDDASVAFQKQIDAQRKSEQLAKDRADVPTLPPQTREATIAQWQRAGMSYRAAEFLRSNGSMVDAPAALEAAVAVAHGKGHEQDSPQYFDEIRDYFDRHNLRPQSAKTTDEELPAVKRKEAKVESDFDSPNRASMYSAPVSREAPGSYGGDRPGVVRLSPAQKEAARYAGVSEASYAKGVLELRERKERGEFDH